MRNRILWSLKLLGMLVGLSLGALSASPATGSELRPQAVPFSFSVMGDVDVSKVDRSRCPSNLAPRVPNAKPTADVTYSWTSKDRKRVYLRPAPLAKIQTKHNLTVDVVKTVTKRATSILAAGSGTNYAYYLMAHEVTCYLWGCKVTNSVNVRVLVDYRKYGTQTYGVVTAYCEGVSGRCPDYVKNAVNT